MAHALNMYDNEYIKFAYKDENYVVEIQKDDEPWDPREENDTNIVKLMCWHPRYRLGDAHGYKNPDDFLDDMLRKYTNVSEDDAYDMSISEKLTEIHKNSDIVMLPVYLYEHSGLALYLSAPGGGCDSFDTSMLGWAVLEKEDFLRVGLDSAAWGAEKAKEIITDEFNVYSQYINGDVYGYTLYDMENEDEPEEIDSCWGFFGADVVKNGIADSVPGLMEAIKSGSYTTGIVQTKTHTYTTKTFA